MTSQGQDVALTERVRALAAAEGVSLTGFGDMSGLAHLPRAVVIAVRHSPEVFASAEEMPTYAYYQEYLSLNERLDEIAGSIAEVLRDAGYAAQVNPATQRQLDYATLAAPFPHKTAATRAGLGWIGKSGLLVTRELGPAVRLSSVLTAAPLVSGAPITESECGECTACEEACPGGAISGLEWRAGMAREEFFDAFACARAARARAQARGIEQTVCGICMLVCPKRRG
jgi:epoxyqueuosine reductase QueG